MKIYINSYSIYNICIFDEINKYYFAPINVMSITATEEQQQEQETIEGIPVCGSNLSTPVIDTSAYISEIYYKIGNRLYIENAD